MQAVRERVLGGLSFDSQSNEYSRNDVAVLIGGLLVAEFLFVCVVLLVKRAFQGSSDGNRSYEKVSSDQQEFAKRALGFDFDREDVVASYMEEELALIDDDLAGVEPWEIRQLRLIADVSRQINEAGSQRMTIQKLVKCKKALKYGIIAQKMRQEAVSIYAKYALKKLAAIKESNAPRKKQLNAERRKLLEDYNQMKKNAKVTLRYAKQKRMQAEQLFVSC
ncbi:hypothetical protein K0U07_02995 [bacterium]|nr:hypothetical protein [bacterium]